MIGKFMIAFFAAIAVLGFVGFLLSRGKSAEKERDDIGNVGDLNDRFNRARYMAGDGK
jgi:hypothetical protein